MGGKFGGGFPDRRCSTDKPRTEISPDTRLSLPGFQNSNAETGTLCGNQRVCDTLSGDGSRAFDGDG